MIHSLVSGVSTNLGFLHTMGEDVLKSHSRPHDSLYKTEEVGQLSRDIFRPMILRYFLSASKRPVD